MTIELLAAFCYLWSIIDNYDVIKQYLIDGGRKAGKTTQAVKWLILIALSRKKINILGVRKTNEDAVGKFSELFISVLRQFNCNYKQFKGKQRIILENGNYIDYKGSTGQNGQPKFSGYAVDNNPDYVIVIVDEAYELSKKEWNGVYEGVRTDTSAKIIFIRLSNNWKSVNWYVRLLNALLQFKHKVLQKEGEQIEIVDNKLIHHCNIRINHFLPEDEVEKLVDTYIEDEERGKVSLDGIPGTLEGAVFNDDVDKYIKDIPFEWRLPEESAIGIHLTSKRKSIGMVKLSYYNEYKSVSIDEEYSYSQDFEDPFKRETIRMNEIADKILNWTLKSATKDEFNEIDFQDIVVVVSSDDSDNSMIAFASTLEKIIEQKNEFLAQFIDFTLPFKMSDEEKIDLVKQKIITDDLIIKSAAERTLIQFNAASYTESNKTKRDEEGFDELISAVEAAMSVRKQSLIN